MTDNRSIYGVTIGIVIMGIFSLLYLSWFITFCILMAENRRNKANIVQASSDNFWLLWNFIFFCKRINYEFSQIIYILYI